MSLLAMFLSVFNGGTRQLSKTIATGTPPKIANIYNLHGINKRRFTRNLLRGRW